MDLDFNFINRAQKVTSFNLTTSDFTSLAHKREIQYLFNSHFFPKFDIDKALNSINMQSFNSLISKLRAESPEMLSKLHNYNLKGVGPGEATIFFLVNNAYLGGGSSAGVDVFVGSSKYEVKAVKLTQDRIAIDFKLGGTVPLSDVMIKLNAIRENLKLSGSKTEISGSLIAAIKQGAPVEFAKIEEDFADLAYNNYFKNHDIIFINNQPGAKLGNIEAIKRVAAKDVMIERVTSGTIKPKVKL